VNKIALIGGAGFIGSHLTKRLVRRGTAVRIVDLSRARLDAAGLGSVPVEMADVFSDPKYLDDLASWADLVVNLAAVVRPGEFLKRPLDVVGTNLDGGRQLIDACMRADTRLFIFSTCEVYGKARGDETPFGEETSDCVLGPIREERWIYAATKQLLDRIVHAHVASGALSAVTVRPFNFVGPQMDWLMDGAGDGQPRVFAQFASALIEGRPLQLVEDGTSRRSFTHIEDGVDALELLIDRFDEARGNIYNIGDPKNDMTIADFAHVMADVYVRKVESSARPRFERVKGEDFYGPGYADCDIRIPDIRRITALGWSPKRNLEDALERGLKSYHAEALSRADRLPG
jgi:UDP-apiose/xylose synthase